jgi:CBS domain containing-hemolysin-like protein/mannitol/fructose-specific phosphotransferase system IIA component (Ntr-type)
MDWMTPVYLLIALLLIFANGFFVLAEFALVKVRVTRIEELARLRNRRAVVARQMVLHLDSYLAATQLGITVSSLGLGWIGEPAFSGVVEAIVGLPGWWTPAVSHSISAVAAFLIITFLHILLGELAPKSLAIRRAEASTLFIAYPMLWAYRLFYLPMVILNGASNLLLRLVGLEAGHPDVAHTEQELRMLLSTAETTSGFSLNRLLMLENIFDLGQQTIQDAMIPWQNVMYLSRSATLEDVLKKLAEHRFSRWPVLDPATSAPTGYLLMKDLIAHEVGDKNWQRLIRPLRTVGPHDNLEMIMQRLQKDGANMAVVVEGGKPVGLITLEDILEEVVGRIEDEYPRLPRLFLKEALTAGNVVLDFPAQTPEEAIRGLAAHIPTENLPPGADVCALALARERQMATDVGHGVAIPHARCPGLTKPLIVFGRSEEGITFTEKSTEPVRLLFLIVTPAERPNVQVFLLEQLASVARSEFVRERLLRAQTQDEVFEIIAAADPAVTG